MKRFKSEAMKVIYEDAAGMFKCGIINKDELLEYEIDCFAAMPGCAIEPASPEECVMIEKRVREYHENLASFISLKDRKASNIL